MGVGSLEMAMQCVQVWLGPGLRLVIEEMEFFRLGGVPGCWRK